MQDTVFEIEKALDIIPFYQQHPEYKPFVGNYFDKYRILQVGESHYIEQKKDSEKDIYSIGFFEKHWWKEAGPEEWNSNCNTRTVINNYLAGKRTRAHGIFTEMVKIFSRVYTDTPIKSISKENSQTYHHFAFMNFYQMPSLYKGVSYRDSLLKSAKKLYGKDKKCAEVYAERIWEDTAKKSRDVLNQVIDILDPQVIIFTSRSAYNAYKKYGGKHIERKGLFHCVHPGCKYWHKPTDDQIGKQELEKALNAFLGK